MAGGCATYGATPLALFPVEKVKVGAMICYDRHFPEAARTLWLKGADLILHPAATGWFSRVSGAKQLEYGHDEDSRVRKSMLRP
ncbi:nitrilase-related carbon-nitrogen hydrolase [Agrobacterium tumefaciens]|uniref:nitrilase-related carbon-nitrogen hydrolase n=1 Tax=Agrobacterium tumefaciens TaxID=358 RepID=UPI00234FEC18|nr:nitrilase-related carbon-nitrogen hydrolase [Agrobacterium tumefaciens]